MAKEKMTRRRTRVGLYSEIFPSTTLAALSTIAVAQQGRPMKKYCGAEDIYRELVDESDQSWLLGLLAFAIVEEQRIEWMRHHEKINGSLPSSNEVQGWYHQQPASVLLRAKGTAESTLQLYSEEVAAAMDGDHRKEIEQGIIVGEIRGMKRFWSQFGVNLAGGFVSAILFAALLTLIAFFVINDTSPVEIVKDLKQQTTAEAGTNGK